VAAGHDGAHLADRTAGHDASLGEHYDPIRQHLGLLEVVRGEQDGATRSAQPADGRPQMLACGHIQADAGLIQEQHLRATADGERKLNLPLLAAGELVVVPARKLGDLRELQHFGNAQRTGVVTGRLLDQLAHLQAVTQHHILHHDADSTATRDRQR
jgi:hypothetical protein